MSNPKSGTILYCYAGHSIFGKADIVMLSGDYKVKVAHFDIEKTMAKKIWSFIGYNFRVTKAIFGVKAVVINFGSWHTIWPVLMAKTFRIPSIVLLGGFDAMSVPSLEYGVFYRKGLYQKLIRKTYRRATWLCPVSDALVESVNYYADPDRVGYKTGLLSFMPEIANKIKVIPRFIDDEFWDFTRLTFRNDILAVAYIYDSKTFLLKGFDLLVACAQMLPEYRFTFAGFSPEMIERYKKSMPPNVTLHGLQSREQIRTLYSYHKIFVLPSMTEGIGNTILEAMLCGCTPIASDVGIFKDLIGEEGFILPYRDVDMLSDIVVHALMYTKTPERVRQRVLDYFEGKDRKESLTSLIESR